MSVVMNGSSSSANKEGDRMKKEDAEVEDTRDRIQSNYAVRGS